MERGVLAEPGIEQQKFVLDRGRVRDPTQRQDIDFTGQEGRRGQLIGIEATED
ncbi:hypothetical protein EBESD8_15750 [Rhodococcus aetherivorans]|nr:hypothetical protein EBESD8_15750 [Rhodococcus aetherivorans]